ncbi:MAG: hypothetical protein GX116_08245 [Fibrobacter sp.]|nr:hypothetical protein [Fibrobacter sp.]
MIFRIILLFLPIFLLSCNKPHAGGPGSETTNGITTQVFDSKGKPAAKAGVALRKFNYVPNATFNPEVILPDYYTDSLGFVVIDTVLEGKYRINIEQNGELLSQEFSFKNKVDLGELYLEKPGSISGFISLPSQNKFAWVGVYGTDLLVQTDSLGAYTLDLPSSKDSLILYIKTDDFEKTLYEEAIWIEANEHIESFKGVLLQDFDSTSIEKWYLGGDTSITSILSPTDFEKGIVMDSLRNSNVFAITYKMSLSWSWVIIGTKFQNAPLDFSQLDSVSFWARGDGLVRLQLENWSSESEKYGGNLKSYSPYQTLKSDEWTYIVVTPSEFCESTDENNKCDPWEITQKTVSQIHIALNGGTKFFVDDITLYGVKF